MEQSFHYKDRVLPEWVDYNGHMNDAEYNRAFSLATDAIIDYIGLDETARDKYAYTIFTLETHICYLKEMHEDEPFEITARVLDYDSKRIHLFLTMKNQHGEITATLEEMLMGMDQRTGRPSAFPDDVEQKIRSVSQMHADQEHPKQAGRTIGIRRK
ncbi:thioesterase family protein [Halobacillus sp. Cin3]|uniref:thioesterase family protein n=1 Tax=Halobacillus sp. Cin3 TaxID=2928441 RepID=UPI00248EB907|nr:thioesterase family protein [Halobacillus sp. Cin3]